MKEELTAAGLGEDRGNAEDPQTDEFSDDDSIEDSATLQQKRAMINKWRTGISEKLPAKPELRREERILSRNESMESRWQPEDATVPIWPKGEPRVPGGNKEPPTSAEMPSRKSTASIDRTTFTRTTPLSDKIWKQQRVKTTDEQEQRITEEVRKCTCYQFDPRCWAKSGFGWEAHCKFCKRCRRWGSKDCELPQHQAERKKEVLTEISQAKATLGRVIRNNT